MALTELAYRIGDPVLTKVLAPPFGGRGQYVYRGPRDRRRVALTFDDGPSRGSTEALLDVLAELGVPATFFCVGENVAMNPDIVERLDREGHVVGSHSQSHRRGAGLSLRDTDHIDAAERQIVGVLGKPPALYRPPWGWLTPWEGRRLHQRGYTIVGWDVYTLDWQIPEPPASEVARKAAADTRPGSIYCFHDAFPLKQEWAKSVTVEAMKLLVPEVRDRGFEFVTVPDLLDIAPYRDASAAAA